MDLFGVNIGGWLSQATNFDETHLNTFITESDVKTIKKWGFNTIRLPVDYFFFQEDNISPEYREDRLAYIDRFLEWASKEQIFVILDLHKAPGCSFYLEEVQYNDAWNKNSLNHQLFLKIWDMLSKRYRNQKNIIYEIVNEPVLIKSQLWMDLAEEIIKTIRSNDTEHYIVVESNLWGFTLTFNQMKKFDDDKIIYSFHYYQPILVTHQMAEWIPVYKYKSYVKYYDYPVSISGIKTLKENIVGEEPLFSIQLENEEQKWNKNTLEAVMKNVLDFKNKYSVPILCGEFGCIVKARPETRKKWISDLMSIFKKHKISYTYWSYKNMDFGLYDFTELYKDNPNYNKERIDINTLEALQKGIF